MLLTIAQFIAASLRLDDAPLRSDETLQIPDNLDWQQLVHHADGHSLTPLLYDTWRSSGMLVQLPADIWERMAQAYRDNARRNRYIRQEVVEIDQILNEAGVSHVILKGWPLVEQLYRDPAHRVLYDHDLLVPAEQAETGQRALKAAGFRPLPGKDEWIEKHLQPLWRNDGYSWDGYLFDPLYPRPVELHLLLWEQGWRGLDVGPLPNLWDTLQSTTVAGVPMQLLSPENTLVHLAMHFAGHLIEREARLNQLLDLARFVDRQSTAETFRWKQVLGQAASANVGRFVYASIYLAHQIFGAPLPPASIWQQLAASTPPGFHRWLTEQGVVDVLTSDYRRVEKGKDYQLTFLAASSMAERLGILRFASLPPMEQLLTKYGAPRWMGPLLLPRYLLERVGTYGRGMLGR